MAANIENDGVPSIKVVEQAVVALSGLPGRPCFRLLPSAFRLARWFQDALGVGRDQSVVSHRTTKLLSSAVA
jgi:hypothetical protein